MKQENFVLTLDNFSSPVLITVPHGGMKNGYGSWLESFFCPRTKPENENYVEGERVVIGGDNQILHIVSDILKDYAANAVIGLLPRYMVDYNRFVPRVAYSDDRLSKFYNAYHESIEYMIERMLVVNKNVVLFDFHGFGKQPIIGKDFDIILGTNDGESSPRHFDQLLFNFMSEYYNIFCYGMGEDLVKESDLYKGDTTNLHYYRKYPTVLDSMLIEVSPRFRSSKIDNSKQDGKELSKNFAIFLKKIEDTVLKL